MSFQYSPWGHAVTPGDGADVFVNVRKDYAIRSFPAEFSFIMRNRELEDDFDPRSFNRKKKPYIPDKRDPFVFRSMAHYTSVLANVRAVVDRFESDLRSEGILTADGKPGAVDVPASPRTDAYSSVLISEYDVCRKFTVQRAYVPFWYMPEKPPRESVLTKEHASVFEALAAGWKRAVPDRSTVEEIVPVAEMADPVDTNIGAPYFKGADGVMALVLRLTYAADFADALKPKSEPLLRVDDASPLSFPESLAIRLRRLGEARSMPAAAVCSVAANSRSGAARNRGAKILRPSGGELRHRETIENFPRTRQVFMAPWWYNLATGSVSRVMKAIRKSVPGWWHDADGTKWLDGALNSGSGVVIESDISGLDQNISPQHRRYILSRVASLWSDCLPQWVLHVILQHNFLPYVTPDPTSGAETRFAAMLFLPQKAGVGLYSGIKITSDINSMFVTWAVALGLHRAGLLSLAEMRDPGWPTKFGYANAGDDVILMLPRGADFTKVSAHLQQAYDEFGVEGKLSPGRRFLMRHRIAGSNFPVLGRIMQQTVSNEHVPDSEGLFMLGASARSDGLHDLNLVMRKAPGALAAIWTRYYEGCLAIMRDTTLGDKILPLILESDMRKRHAMRNIFAALLMKQQRSASLLDIIQAERFSASGRELAEALKTTALMHELLKSDRLRVGLHAKALAITGAHI